MEIFAHRGIHESKNEENSRQALEKIYASKADGIEMDLRLTKDGICVLSHDTKHDSRLRISRNTYEALIKDNNLLQIDDAMDILRDYRGLINLEIKHVFGEIDQKMGLMCLEILAQKKKSLFKSLESNILISSFSRNNIAAGERLFREVPRALLVARPTRFIKVIEQALASRCSAIHLSVRQTYAQGFEEFLSKARKSHLEVRIFTVNDEDTLLWLESLGVDGIFTDKVEEMLVLKK